jgi:signal transduction histidine kinase
MAAPEREWDGSAGNHTDAIPAGHLVTTRSTRILSADVAAAALLQRPVAILEQKPLAALVDIEERRTFRARLLELEADGSIDEWQLCLRGPAGTPIDVVATVRGDTDGDVDFDVHADAGLLRWKLVPNPVRGSERDDDALQSEVWNMARELRQLAHELNQPLAAIVTYARGTQMRLESGALSDADLRAALDVLVTQALRATEIVRALDRKWGSS